MEKTETASNIEIDDFLKGGHNPRVPDRIKQVSEKLKERALKVPDVDPGVFERALERVRYNPWQILKRRCQGAWREINDFLLSGYRKRVKIKGYGKFLTKAELTKHNPNPFPTVPFHEFMYQIDESIKAEQKKRTEESL